MPKIIIATKNNLTSKETYLVFFVVVVVVVSKMTNSWTDSFP